MNAMPPMFNIVDNGFGQVGRESRSLPPAGIKAMFWLAAAMFASGWAGLNIVIPPGYASPLWPPAGIALAALLIWGRRLWPGVWLGATATQFLAIADFTEHYSLVSALTALVIGGGSTLQVLAACYLSAKYLEPGLPKLDSPRSILGFFVLTAPLACLIAPSVGVAALFAAQFMPPEQLGSAWRNWWIGDCLGVTVVTPLLLCWFGMPRELWRPRGISVALPLLAALLALVLVFVQVFRAEQARIQVAFDNRAGEIERLLTEYAANVLDNTLALRDVFVASEEVTRREFAVFAQGILLRHPEIQALEWLPLVKAARLAAFETSVRAEGYREFRVTERQPDGSLAPAELRPEYCPVAFIEPMPGNQAAFGLDSCANSASKASKDYARETGKISASPLLNLIQDTAGLPGILVSAPLIKQASSIDAPVFEGYISAVLLPAKMVDIVTQGLSLDEFGLKIEDLGAPETLAVLFAKPIDSLTGKYALKEWHHRFAFADRTWQITVSPGSGFVAAQGSSLPWITLIGGLCFASLLNVLLLIVSGRTAHVEALIEERTDELENAVAELQSAAAKARESEVKLRTIVDSEPDCVKLLDTAGRLLQINPAGLDMIGAESLEQAQALDLAELIVPKYRAAFEGLSRRVFAGVSGTLEFEIIGLKGRHRWLDTHSVPMRDAEGRITALLGLTRDITERKRAEEHLRLAARVFSDAHEGILITDANANIIDVNPTFCDITGYSRTEVLGQNPRFLQSGKHPTDFYADIWRTLRLNSYWRGELWNRKKNGELYAEHLTISALCDADGNTSHYIGLFSDVTHAKQQQQLLELIAHYDPLTGLPNRILFADRLNRAIAHAKREPSLLAICFLDLDGFKPVNDQFGHDAGDRVLVEIAERIKGGIREEDSVSRHGGDEFALLLGGIESVEQCEQAILRIHRAISQPILIDDQPVEVGASTGFTVFPLDDADPDTLLRHADQAMYQAKMAGKNCFRLFDTNRDQQIIHRNLRLKEIEEAFGAGQFCLYYQPKVNIQTGRVTGAEALLRWRHPEQGLVPPLSFLPAIASTELEIRIGNWVIAEACRQLADWQAQGLNLEVSVNVSSYHLLWPGLYEHIEATLAQYPAVDSTYLQLEILESTALDDLTAVNRTVRHCREELGISIALDDFGTGYSSLTHLRHLSVDTVKIDQSFVRDMLDDPDDYAIIESVIGLSQAFRRRVIAEGVENPDHGTVLLLMGCQLLQGYAIARPMPAADLPAWIAAYRPYSEWRHYANAGLAPDRALVEIRKFDTRHWLEHLRDSLNAESGADRHWPILNPRKCHLGRWLKQAKAGNKHSQAWLNQIEVLHQERHRLASDLKHRYDAGEIAVARNGFEQVRAVHDALYALLVAEPEPDTEDA
ncbi:EAL domain-containing protein [Methylomonas sp. UP202]|uniref:EAL domain-containing protein n=1 Tax=Methylomonas sp. UP202 TaxID=3040943 RepID=UPI002479E1C1|nr:EAL domain-containing protein [Methylomonas sp. UP202]WGS86210.1 EAL domain-containing protein [Methylomonas sp. UP202]